jgi:hypothetical protein
MISDERDRQIEARNERIRQLRAQGHKRVTIARPVGTSNSTVDGVIYRLRQSPCQDGKS